MAKAMQTTEHEEYTVDNGEEKKRRDEKAKQTMHPWKQW